MLEGGDYCFQFDAWHYSILALKTPKIKHYKVKSWFTFVPIASSSSINIMAGAFSLARANASLTSLAPSPINIYIQQNRQSVIQSVATETFNLAAERKKQSEKQKEGIIT